MPAEPLQTPSVFTGWVEAAYTLFSKSEEGSRVEIGDVVVILGSGVDGNFNVVFWNATTARQAHVQYWPKERTGLEHNLVSGIGKFFQNPAEINRSPRASTFEIWRLPELELLSSVTSVATFIHTLFTYKSAESRSQSIEDYLHAR